MEIQAAAANAAVASFYESLNSDQLRALSLIYGEIISHPGHPEHPIATFQFGQVVALLRHKFGMCSCGEDHKAENHAKVSEERERKNAKPDNDQLADNQLTDNTHLLEEYRIEYVDGGPQVRCKGVYRVAAAYGPVNCSTTWKSIDERMLQGRCGTCGYGPGAERE